MRTLLRLASASVACLLLAGLARAGDGRPPVLHPAQDAWKQQHVATVAEELARRDAQGLTAGQREARARLVAALGAYGERGVFAQDPVHPGDAMSHLIDPFGTRCALAHLIDVAGDASLLDRLAAEHNDAFVPELLEDDAFRAWLVRNGLTPDEAAWIQAPGFVDPTVTPRDSGDAPGGSSTLGGSGRRRAVTSSATEATWPTWWSLNRDDLLDLRARYHAAFTSTGPGSEQGRRVSGDEVGTLLLPFLRGLALRPDCPVRETALMAWARVARGDDGAAVVEATLDYLRTERGPWRDLMVLALGVPRHEAALAPLMALVRDDRDGRRLLGRADVPATMQAFAALALGQLGRPEGVEALLAAMAGASSDDLRCACWLGMAGCVRDDGGPVRAGVIRRLVERFRSGDASDEEAAILPAALAVVGDPVALPVLEETLARFRKPEAARPACALAIAALAPRLTSGLADTLIGTSRRDPDPDARRFALIALGTLAERSADAEVGAKVARFFQGTFDGLGMGKQEMPWVALAAARFARGFPAHRDDVVADLRAMATDRGAKDRQAAAVMGLALLDDRASLGALRKDFAGAHDVELRSWLAEGLGALGSREEIPELLDLAVSDGSDVVRYRAALGLGYAADPQAVPQLVEALGSSSSHPARTALARVLGEIGDRRALPALMAIAGDEKADDWTRRRALGALAMIGQPGDRAWVRTFQRSVDYTRATSTIGTLLSLF